MGSGLTRLGVVQVLRRNTCWVLCRRATYHVSSSNAEPQNCARPVSISSASKKNPNELLNSLVLCPPSALNDKWSQKFKNVIKGYVSGWMLIRQRVKQKNIELPIIISDHADWNEIIDTVKEVMPSEVLVTHGREEALVHYFKSKKYKSSALNLIGFEDENE